MGFRTSARVSGQCEFLSPAAGPLNQNLNPQSPCSDSQGMHADVAEAMVAGGWQLGGVALLSQCWDASLSLVLRVCVGVGGGEKEEVFQRLDCICIKHVRHSCIESQGVPAPVCR